MKFAFSSNAFRRYSLIETIELLSEAGYGGIEIMADVPHAYPPHLTESRIEEITGVLRRRHMEISNINAFMLRAVGDVHHPSWIEEDPFLRSVRVAHTLLCIDLAEKLGVRTISTEPGGPVENMSAEEGLYLFTEGLLAVRDRAAKRGVRVLIEPEPGLLVENSAQFLALFENLDPECFGLNFDIGHFFCAGEECASLITQLKDYIHHYHLEDIAASREHVHLMPGEGAIDIAGVLRAIEATGYKGFITVELYTYGDRPVEAAQKSLEYLNRLMTENTAESTRPAGV